MSVIEWLESPEGEEWSKAHHNVPNRGAILVSVVTDNGYTNSIIWYA